MRYLIFSLFFISTFIACKQESSSTLSYQSLNGKTMGTTYQVTYADSLSRNFNAVFDSFLVQINKEVSTYIPTSTISLFNQADSIFIIEYDLKSSQSADRRVAKKKQENLHFISNLLSAGIIHKATNGYFDPTVMPLVNYWGFGYEERGAPSLTDSLLVDSLRQLVGFNRVIRPTFGEQVLLRKSNPNVQLDFSAIAKGHAVDVLAMYLEAQGVDNYMVEIGGEVRARGVNAQNKAWRIGIQVPKEGVAVDDFQQIISLENAALATSGNYRNFYERDGYKYVHTIHPATGFPERNRLLSASVLARECKMADAYATAMMVMGIEKSKSFVSSQPSIAALLIYSDNSGELQTWQSDNISEFVRILEEQ